MVIVAGLGVRAYLRWSLRLWLGCDRGFSAEPLYNSYCLLRLYIFLEKTLQLSVYIVGSISALSGEGGTIRYFAAPVKYRSGNATTRPRFFIINYTVTSLSGKH